MCVFRVKNEERGKPLRLNKILWAIEKRSTVRESWKERSIEWKEPEFVTLKAAKTEVMAYLLHNGSAS